MAQDRVPDAGVTALLIAVQRGDRQALDKLFPLVYEELRSVARSQRRRWHGDYTMSTTAIVNEAYIKLVEHEGIAAESRGHFFAIAARAMRHILCNYARDRRRLKRGAGVEHVSIDDAMAGTAGDVSDVDADDLAALDRALEKLEQVDERQSRIVECRFFAGMSIEETAAALGLSPATVKRDWVLARAWIYREVKSDSAP